MARKRKSLRGTGTRRGPASRGTSSGGRMMRRSSGSRRRR